MAIWRNRKIAIAGGSVGVGHLNTEDVQRPKETKKRKGKIILFRRGRRGGKRWNKWQLVDYLFVRFPMVPRLLSAALLLACRLSVALNWAWVIADAAHNIIIFDKLLLFLLTHAKAPENGRLLVEGLASAILAQTLHIRELITPEHVVFTRYTATRSLRCTWFMSDTRYNRQATEHSIVLFTLLDVEVLIKYLVQLRFAQGNVPYRRPRHLIKI